ncbi:YihY/virulence factor BrkB family protein [Desulfovibrionales bacterium]
MSFSFFSRCQHFFTITLWKEPPSTPFVQRLFWLLRVFTLSWRGFQANNGPLRAAALTVYTLLSLVPLAAMAFAVATGFGLERLLENELLAYFSGQHDVLVQVIAFARNMLANTRTGLIAGVGVIVLFWSVLSVLSAIEKSFNQIWGAPSRSWPRKITDYLTITLVVPLFLVIAGSATVFATTQVLALSAHLGLDQMASPLVSAGVRLMPVLILWAVFTLLYIIMPNTEVRLSNALPAALLTGSAFQAMQVVYITFQIVMTGYNAIYGSFAALPLFLLWLKLSWHIVLFGAELTYAFQTTARTGPVIFAQNLSQRQIKLLALTLTAHVAQRFERAESPQTPQDIAQVLGLPAGLVQSLIDLLVRAKILSRLDGPTPTTRAVQPACNTARLRASDVVLALDTTGSAPILQPDIPALQGLDALLQALEQSMISSWANKPITQLHEVQVRNSGYAD